MPHWSFKQRGQVSLIVLLIMGWLMCLSMGIFQATLIYKRTTGYEQSKMNKAMTLNHGLVQALIHHSQQGKGTGEIGAEAYRWKSLSEEGIFLDSQLTEVRFQEQSGWPRMRGLRIQGQGFHLFIKDYHDGR